MNLPSGTHLAYEFMHDPHEFGTEFPRITVFAAQNGTTGWDTVKRPAWWFTIEEKDIGTLGRGRSERHLTIYMLDFQFPAFAGLSELFAALGTGRVQTLLEVKQFLDRLGAADETGHVPR